MCIEIYAQFLLVEGIRLYVSYVRIAMSLNAGFERYRYLGGAIGG